MGTPQFIQTTAGERLVVLAEKDYIMLLEQAGISQGYLSEIEARRAKGWRA